MRKRKIGRKFGRTHAKRHALLFGITESVFRYGRIKTTEARAKEAGRLADRAITVGKQGTLAARRRLERTFTPAIAKSIVDEIAPRFKGRSGGYTRIVKIGFRRGDRAPLAFLELIKRGK